MHHIYVGVCRTCITSDFLLFSVAALVEVIAMLAVSFFFLTLARTCCPVQLEEAIHSPVRGISLTEASVVRYAYRGEKRSSPGLVY